MPRLHPVAVLPYEECDRRDPSRDHSPSSFASSFAVSSARVERSRMRRKTSPSHRARQTELVEMCRLVTGNAAPENVPFPCTSRNFKALELPDNFQRAVLAAHLRSRSDVLPPQQHIHELRSRHLLDLLAQRGK